MVQKMMQNSRGQVTTQSLMKYGMAIFAMIAVAAIVYFGLFSSKQSFEAKEAKCKLPGNLICTRSNLSVTSTNNRLALTNDLGIDITINDIRIGSKKGTFQCTATDDGDSPASPLPTFVAPGSSYIHVFGPSKDFPANGCVTSGAKAGDKLKWPLAVKYTNLRTKVKYTLNGTISAELQT